jgi:hypothetical protein
MTSRSELRREGWLEAYSWQLVNAAGHRGGPFKRTQHVEKNGPLGPFSGPEEDEASLYD